MEMLKLKLLGLCSIDVFLIMNATTNAHSAMVKREVNLRMLSSPFNRNIYNFSIQGFYG